MISQTTPAGYEAGKTREVDGSLGLTDALEHAARLRSQREHVPRLDEVARRRIRMDRHLDRLAAIRRRDAGGHAFARFDADRERSAERRLVVVGHRAQPHLVGALLGEAQADEPARMRRHEVDRLRRRELRGDRQVALVLAAGIVDHDDHPALADLRDGLLDRCERCRDGHERRLATRQPVEDVPPDTLVGDQR